MHVLRHRDARRVEPFRRDHTFPASGAVVGAIGQRKNAILALAAAGLIAACVYAVARPPAYSVRTVLEIGALAGPDGQRWVETPEIVSKKITEAYAPLAWIETRSTAPLLDEETPRISGKVARNTNIVILETAATEQDISAHKSFHDRIFTQLKDDHDRIFNVSRSGLEAERQTTRTAIDQLADRSDLAQSLAPINADISQSEAKLSALEDERQYGVLLKEYQSQIAIADNRLKDLAEAAVLLERTLQQKQLQDQQAATKLARLKADIDTHAKNRIAAAQNTASGSEAMTLMLLDVEKERVAEERDKLEQFLTMDSPIERSRLENEFASNQREQTVQKLTIEKARAELLKQQIVREKSIDSLKPSLTGLKAKLENTMASRDRSMAVETAKLRDLDQRLENMAITRRLFAPQPPFERADIPAIVIIPVCALAGLLLGLAQAFLAHIFSLARTTPALPRETPHREPEQAARVSHEENDQPARSGYTGYEVRKPYPM